jgi:hypothetical protein
MDRTWISDRLPFSDMFTAGVEEFMNKKIDKKYGFG